MVSVIVAADDIGLTLGITDGILRCVDRGSLDSVSLVPNGWDFDRAAAELRRRPAVRVSVHANLVEGTPVSPPDSVSRLVGPDGRFHNSFVSLWLRHGRSMPGRRRDLAAQVEREVRAQTERVRAALGEDRPLHLDSHQHVHMVPFVFDIFLRLAVELRLHGLRLTCEPWFLHTGRGAAGAYFGSGLAKHLLLRLCSIHARSRLRAGGVAHCDHLVGVLFTGRMTAEVVRDALAALDRRGTGPRTVEVLFHPGRATDRERALWDEYPGHASFYCSPGRDREAESLSRLKLPRNSRRAS